MKLHPLMKVHPGRNGWNGIWIPGDEALDMADAMRMMAEGKIAETQIAPILRLWAAQLERCRQDEIDPDGIPGDYNPK